MEKRKVDLEAIFKKFYEDSTLGYITTELLRLFVWKIVVHEKDIKWSKHAQQTVDIYYNDIGCVGADAERETTPQESA